MTSRLLSVAVGLSVLTACVPDAPTCAPEGIVVVCRCGAANGTASCQGGKLSECDCTDSGGVDSGGTDASAADAGDAYPTDGPSMSLDMGGGDLDTGAPMDSATMDGATMDGATMDGATDVDAFVDVDSGLDGGPGIDSGLDAGRDAGTDAGRDASAVDANVDGGTPGAPFPSAWDGRMPTDGVCSPAGWCWVYPRVPDLDFVDIATLPATGEMWALGRAFGAILHFDGTSWTGVTHGFDGSIAISAASASSVWILTSTNGIYRYDGTSWTATTVPSVPALRGLFAITPSDVYAVGDLGTVLHWDGTSWSVTAAGFSSLSDLRAVHASASNDVWIGGTGGAIRVYDGSTWTDRSLTTDVAALWAWSPTDAWAGGATLRHWTGSAWITPTPRSCSNINDIAGATPSRMYFSISSGVAACQWNGTAMNYASGLAGTASAAAWNGTAFVAAFPASVTPQTGLKASDLTTAPSTSYSDRPIGVIDALFVLGNDDLLATVGTSVLRGSFDTVFVAQPAISGHGTPIEAAGIDDLWTQDATAGYVGHWDGTAWSRMVVSAGASITDFARTPTDVWAATSAGVFRRTGATWTADPTAPAARVLAPSPDGSLFALGNSTAAHFVGGTWNMLPSPSSWFAFDATSHVPDEVTYAATSAVGRLEGGVWRTVTFTTIYSAGATVGRTAWIMAQDTPGTSPARTAYWDGYNVYVAPTYVDGNLRYIHPSVVRDSTGRTWATYNLGQTDVAVLEWRPR